MQPLISRLNKATAQENFSHMQAICEDLGLKLQVASTEGKEKYTTRHKERGKLLARERVHLLLDPGSPFLELMPLAGLDDPEVETGGSIIIGIGLVHQTLVMINANVPTIKGGALNEMSVIKSQRMDQIALENKLPVIYLTESAGADLTHQAKIFNMGGRAFREITRRSSVGIPSISVVFGSSTAGGAYIPGMSDYVVMVKKNAKTYLAGPPLVKMALGEDVDDESLGGAQMHATKSGLCDYLASTEEQALKITRDIIAQLSLPKVTPAKSLREIKKPLYDSEELLYLIPHDPKTPFDIREVIARIVDGSVFSEFKPLYGDTMITGFAEINGHAIGILANNGVIFSESANKAAHFIQICERQKRPLLFLQNTTGFMVGKAEEEKGIIKHGAKLINAVSNAKVPAITIMVANSYGAGNYGMCGRAYDPRFLFSWPNSKLAVMGAEQLAGVMEIIQKQKEQEKGTGLMQGLIDKGKLKIMKDAIRKKIDEESTAYYATSRCWDDGVIDPRMTRDILSLCLEVINENRHALKAEDWGLFRM